MFGRFDVFHLHWPENLISAKNLGRRSTKRLLFAIILLMLRLRSTVVVRTLHNLQPHEDRVWIDRRLIDLADRMTGSWITLNRMPVLGDSNHVRTILHSDYVAWYEGMPRQAELAGHLCFFGQIRPYKNVLALIAAFREIENPEMSLTVAGRPYSSAMHDAVVAAAAPDRRVTYHLDFLSDAQLIAEITGSELVVLPYSDLYNSGAALLALSLARPILLPSSLAAVALQEEFGTEWVYLDQGPLQVHRWRRRGCTLELV